MLSVSSRIQPIGRILLPLLMRQHLRKAHDVAEYFQFQRAIVGTLPCSFVTQSLRSKEPSKPVDLENAKQQHSIYVSELKKLIPIVVQIPPDERFPDSVYVEDPVVVHEGTALIAQMKPDTRAEEFSALRPVLEEMNLRIVEMREPGAYLDGGDVLFTGREFLVGQSERTNAVRRFYGISYSTVSSHRPSFGLVALIVKYTRKRLIQFLQ